MRRIEEANKFELARSIKALVARALADEVYFNQVSPLSISFPVPLAPPGPVRAYPPAATLDYFRGSARSALD